MKNFFLFAMAMAMGVTQAHAKLTVLTDRPQTRFATAVAEFEKVTGEKVELIEAAYPDLLKLIEDPSSSVKPDLIVTKDLVYLAELKTKKLLQPLTLTNLMARVPAEMRDSQNHWVALSYRARTIAYDPSRVDASELTTYENLASEQFRGRLCLRTSKSAYNIALTGFLLAKHGEDETRSILQGWLDNLAAPVFSSDTRVLEEIAKGTCDVGIVNHYYLAQLIEQRPNFPVRIAFLNQKEGGVHTNGSGVGLVASSTQNALAQKFVDSLLGDEFQLAYSSAHFDYPVVQGLTASTLIKNWGSFTTGKTSWGEIGELAPKAQELMTEIGYP